MAINQVTIAEPSRGDTTAALGEAQAISTSTGVYIDVSKKKAGNLILVVRRDSSTKAAKVVVKTGSKFLTNSRGDLTVDIDTNAAAAAQIDRYIAIEPSRHINDSGDIVVTCTASTGILSVGAVLVP